jgi:hypothetical protein
MLIRARERRGAPPVGEDRGGVYGLAPPPKSGQNPPGSHHLLGSALAVILQAAAPISEPVSEVGLELGYVGLAQ